MADSRFKFRAWDGKEYEFFSLESITQDESYRTYLGNLKMNDNTIIEQYTGLKDKKGVEAYENDILSCGNNAVIKFRAGRFVAVYNNGTEEEMEDNLSELLKHNYIIGNIHENLTSNNEKTLLEK